MRIGGWMLATALTGVGLTGCAVRYYPVLPTGAAADLAALTCTQLAEAQGAVARTERQIAEVAANGRTADGARPILYSTAKSDADRAVQARAAALAEARQVRACAA